ncbi:hypothetical protein B0H14DRAFT_2986972, partial [Mycena olivaceomarginata]
MLATASTTISFNDKVRFRLLSDASAPSDLEVKAIRSHLIPHSQELCPAQTRPWITLMLNKALISPEIFLACLPTHRNCVLSANEAPAHTQPHIGGLTNPVTEWLARTGRHPPFRSPSLGHVIWSDGIQRVTRSTCLLDALVRYADRWSTLDLSFDSYEGLLRLQRRVVLLALHTIKTKCDPVELAQLKLLTTPSLRVVTICLWQNFDRYFAPPSPLAVQPPWYFGPPDTSYLLGKSSSMGPMTLEFLIGRLIMPRLAHLQLPRTIRPNLHCRSLGIFPQPHRSLENSTSISRVWRPKYIAATVHLLLESLAPPIRSTPLCPQLCCELHLDIEYKMFIAPDCSGCSGSVSLRAGLSISSSCPTHTWSILPQPDTPWDR